MFKNFKFKLIVITCCIIIVNALPLNVVHAANANKKSLTLTLERNNPLPYYQCKFKLSKTSKLNVRVKILDMSGKTGGNKINWAYYDTNLGKGSLFCYRRASELRKNKTLKFKEFIEFAPRFGKVTFDLPAGVNKMKLKITISTADGKKNIKFFKKKRSKYWY